MFKKYLWERKSWILLFCMLQLLQLSIAYIDTSISLSSMLYINFLSTIIFIGFLVIRYQKESSFFKSLQEWHPSNEIDVIVDARSPFEKIVKDNIQLHVDFYKKEKSHYLTEGEQEKDKLLSWIHEVKTPLTTMQLMLERISDEQLKSQLMYEWLRIHLLLDQQLHEKRLPFVENDLYLEKMEFEPIIYSEIKSLKSWCIQKGIGFEVSLQVKDVISDVKWLSFIMRQLLTNAIKYSSSSDIYISTCYKNENITLIVQDFGRGISLKDLPRIFDRGFTSTTFHKDHGATGMGLYLTKKAADTLGININVNSTINEGTVFTLTFPKKNDFEEMRGM